MHSEITALFTVIIVDLVLAGDNAIVVGLAAAGLPETERRRAVFWGIAAAAALRIVFAVFTTKLLSVIGLTLAGGLLLLWVVWKLFREVRAETRSRRNACAGEETANAPPSAKSFRNAITQIVVADVSMSLDNVLAVAGAARNHIYVLIIGLALSVALMGVAATVIARLLKRHYWISYIGLVIIAYVAGTMIWEGGRDVITEASRAGMLDLH